MNEYIIVYFVSPKRIGNYIVKSFSKKGAIECFKAEETKGIILNIIEL